MDTLRKLKWVAFLAFFTGLVPSAASAVYVYTKTANLPIIGTPGPASTVTESVLDITDSYLISKLDIEINITHTNVFDLQIFLKSPSGSKICLNMYNPYDGYFKGQNYHQTLFDDSADTPIEAGIAPFTGRFRPLQGNLLSTFNGQSIKGKWKLQVYDMFDTNSGTLDSFTIFIGLPEVPTGIFYITAFALSIYLPRKR